MSEAPGLPNTWTRARIDEVCTVNGRAFSLVESAASLPGAFVPMAAVAEEFGGIDISAVRPLAEVRKGYTSFVEGDVLFAKITPCMENGKVAVVPPLSQHIGFGSTEFHVLRSNGAVVPKWLAYYLSQLEFRRAARQGMTGSAGQLRVQSGWLSGATLPVAPLAEQQRILFSVEEVLSELDAGVAELRLAQAKLTQYRQSLLKAAVEGDLTAEWRASNPPQETGAELLACILRERRARWEARQLERFRRQARMAPSDWQTAYPEPASADHSALPTLPDGWTWATVEQLSPDDLANGRSVPTAEQGAKVLRLTAVRRGYIDLDEYKHGEWTAEEAEPFYVQQDDLLIVRGNGSLSLVGRAGLVPRVVDPMAYPDTLIRLRTLGAVVRPAWLAAAWDSKRTRDHMERRARTSAGIYKISQPDIVSVTVAVPPLAEQDEALMRLASSMEQLDAMQAAIGQSLKMAAAQRQNILRAAFSGQLVPQDPNDEPASMLLARIRAQRTQAAPSAPRKTRHRVGAAA